MLFNDLILVARKRAKGELSLEEARAAVELLDGLSIDDEPVTPMAESEGAEGEEAIPSLDSDAAGASDVEETDADVPDPDESTAGAASAPAIEARSAPSDADIDAALATAGRGRR